MTKYKFDELIKLSESNNTIKTKMDEFINSIYLNDDEKRVIKLFENDNIKDLAINMIENDNFSPFDVNKILIYVKHDFLHFLQYFNKESKNGYEKFKNLIIADEYLDKLNKYDFIYYFKGIVYGELAVKCDSCDSNNRINNPYYEKSCKNYKLYKSPQSYQKIAHFYFFYVIFNKFKYYFKKFLNMSKLYLKKDTYHENFLFMIPKNKKKYYIKKSGYGDDNDEYYYYILKNKYKCKSSNYMNYVFFIIKKK